MTAGIIQSILAGADSTKCSWDIMLPIIMTAAFGALAWFIKDKFSSLSENDKRVEGKLDKNFTFLIKETRSIDGRVSRIEGKFGLSLLVGQSPLSLTDTGKEILLKSGIKEAADNFKDTLLEKIKSGNHDTAYDVQENVRRLFQEFDFGKEYVTKIKEYSFQSGKWSLYDILDVGSIYFRDIALSELGLKIEDIDKDDPANRKQ
jgi:hypothetical protein